MYRFEGPRAPLARLLNFSGSLMVLRGVEVEEDGLCEDMVA